MLKITTLALGAAMFFGGALGMPPQSTTPDPVYYRDSDDTTYNGSGSGTAVIESWNIEYTTRSVDSHTLAYRYPSFSFSPAAGSCAAIGGGNLIGFFDRYYENLIPNHVAGSPYANTFLYNQEDEAVFSTIETLYDYMGTTSNGTTEDGFKSGINRYCREKGLSVTYSSCMKNGSLDYAKAQSYLDSNKPIVLFLSGYNVLSLANNQTYEYCTGYVSPNTHVMIGFGYKTYVYDGNRTYRYFAVGSGITGHSSGLYNIDYKTQINDALAVNIY